MSLFNKSSDQATDATVPMPLFVKIASDIRERILDNTYAAHDRLPSEAALMKLYGVSRVTVRQALSVLQHDSLIFKINGKGTFVSKQKTSLDVSQLRGFGEAMSGQGYETFSRVVEVVTKRAVGTGANFNRYPPGVEVTRLERIRYLNREPISLDITYIPPWAGERIVRADLERRDLIVLLENVCGLTLEQAQVNVDSQICDQLLADSLGIKVGEPILHIERRIVDTQGAPVLYENLFYRGESFRYSFIISRFHETERNATKHGESEHV